MKKDHKDFAALLSASPAEALAALGGTPVAPGAPPDEEPSPSGYRHNLTLGVVTHDADAPKLKRLLAGCHQHFGTVVVVDTTPDGPSQAVADVVLEIPGASVHHFPWCDDFAAARNEVLRFCPRYGWLFMLDSDEQLAVQSTKPLWWLVFRADRDHHLEGRPCPDAWRLAFLAESTRGTTLQHLTRVFRLGHQGLRYASRMHEYVVGTRDNSMVLGGVLPSLVLGHDGYSLPEKELQAKSRRNERLADLQADDAPEDPHAWFLVGTCSNNPERAFAHMRRLAEWAMSHPLQAKTQGWIREGLVRAVIRQSEAALSLTTANVPALDRMAKEAWRKAEVLCASARSLLPGLPHTVSDFGEADLRFLHARCKFMLGDPAGSHDVLLPTMGLKSVSWLSPDAAYVERFWLWARILLELREYAQALQVIDHTIEQAGKALTTMAEAYRLRLAPLREVIEREQQAWKDQLLAHLRPDQLKEIQMSEVSDAQG